MFPMHSFLRPFSPRPLLQLGGSRLPLGILLSVFFCLVSLLSLGSLLAAGAPLPATGTVVAWGANNFGQTRVPAGLSRVTAIAAGGDHSLALKSDGTVVAWGAQGGIETAVPAGLSHVTAIAAGYGQSLALKSDGTVAAWGAMASARRRYRRACRACSPSQRAATAAWQ